MTIAADPNAQATPYYPQSFPHGMQRPVPMSTYYPMMAQPGYVPSAGNGVHVTPGMQPNHPGWDVLYPMGEIQNPALGPVTMLHTIRPDVPQEESPAKKKPKKRKRNHPRGPKPARYAWNFYFKEKYQKIRKDGGSGLFDVQEAFTKVGLRLGNAWKALTPEERQPYLDMAAKDRLRYERQMELFNKGLDFNADTKDKEESDAKSDDNTVSSDVKEEKKQEEKEGTKDQASNEAASPSRPPATHTVTADILVTDDDDAFIMLMEATLKRINKKMEGTKVNLNIHKAKSGSEALTKVLDEQQKYAVITMDKEMGSDSLDGCETIKKMRDSGYDGFVVGVTGHPESKESFKSNGADATLTKGSSKLYSQIYDYVIEKVSEAGEKQQTDGTSNTKTAAKRTVELNETVSQPNTAEPKAIDTVSVQN